MYILNSNTTPLSPSTKDALELDPGSDSAFKMDIWAFQGVVVSLVVLCISTLVYIPVEGLMKTVEI